MPLAARVRDLCRREALFRGDGQALVMVSGGQDSLALLHLLATGALGAHGPRSVRAVHVNHHLRGEESRADQALVEERCRDFGVPLSVVDAPVEKSAGNVQEEARRGRRAAAEAVAREAGISVVALAHTLDDQVETLLYRLGRYGGLRALAAMSATEPPWVRPLLGVRREETAAYCRAHGLMYAVDRGNEYPGYARTGLRGTVVPAWEEVLPGAVEAAGRAAEVAGEAYQVIREVVDAVLAQVSLESSSAQGGSQPGGSRAGGSGAGGSRAVSVRPLLHLSSAVRRAVLHALLEACPGAGGSRSLVLDLEAFLAGDGQAGLALGGGWRAERAYGRVAFVSAAAAPAGAAVPVAALAAPAGAAAADVAGAGSADGGGARVALPCPGEVAWGGLLLVAAPAASYRAHDPRVETYLDERAVAGGMWVRVVRAGDRMRPLGASGGRLLQDILVDRKVPRSLRPRVPVVGCGDTIVWLAGYVVAEEGRIGPTTRRLVRVSVREREPGTGSRPPEGGEHPR